MNGYSIIDEPSPRFTNALIVRPVIILFAAILVPFFWYPPLQGRIWMPLLWLAMNGYFLGSPTLKKEVIITFLGGTLALALPYICVFSLFLIGAVQHIEMAIPYVRIIGQGLLFFILYLVVTLQSTPYEIYNYIKEQANN